mmetsp:Transcript_18194/g.45521  ORF Transcript_18194/g.45521 Transcript_18194/m.45521 type:complete len:240 (+) Transcript_18194:258-977(+)
MRARWHTSYLSYLSRFPFSTLLFAIPFRTHLAQPGLLIFFRPFFRLFLPTFRQWFTLLIRGGHAVLVKRSVLVLRRHPLSQRHISHLHRPPSLTSTLLIAVLLSRLPRFPPSLPSCGGGRVGRGGERDKAYPILTCPAKTGQNAITQVVRNGVEASQLLFFASLLSPIFRYFAQLFSHFCYALRCLPQFCLVLLHLSSQLTHLRPFFYPPLRFLLSHLYHIRRSVEAGMVVGGSRRRGV